MNEQTGVICLNIPESFIARFLAVVTFILSDHIIMDDLNQSFSVHFKESRLCFLGFFGVGVDHLCELWSAIGLWSTGK